MVSGLRVDSTDYFRPWVPHGTAVLGVAPQGRDAHHRLDTGGGHDAEMRSWPDTAGPGWAAAWLCGSAPRGRGLGYGFIPAASTMSDRPEKISRFDVARFYPNHILMWSAKTRSAVESEPSSSQKERSP